MNGEGSSLGSLGHYSRGDDVRRRQKRKRRKRGGRAFDEDVMMRARKWFEGEEVECVKSSEHWYDSMIDKEKLKVKTPSHNDPDVESNADGEKKSLSPKSFGLFNFHKRESSIIPRKKKIPMRLKADFLSVAKLPIHTQAMKAIAVREHYVNLLEETLKNSRVEGVMYRGGPKYLFEFYLSLFSNLCKATVNVVEAIDEWRYDIEQNAKISYFSKAQSKLERPKFMWNYKIVRGLGRVNHKSVDYMDKILMDTTKMLSQAVLPSKQGGGTKKVLIIDAAKVSGNFLHGIPVSPFLVTHTLEQIVNGGASPAPQSNARQWELGLMLSDEKDEDDEEGFSVMLEDRVFGSQTWYDTTPERVRKAAMLLHRHEEYRNARQIVDSSGGLKTLSSSINMTEGQKIVPHATLSKQVARAMLLHDHDVLSTGKRSRRKNANQFIINRANEHLISSMSTKIVQHLKLGDDGKHFQKKL